jgi:hypothetical protein
MKTTMGCSKAAKCDSETTATLPFQLLLLYDEQAALVEARQLVERLPLKTGIGLDVHRDEISFAELAYPEIQKEAAELAGGCDVFIFATVNGLYLRKEITSWLRLWFQTRQKKDTALVCLIGSPQGVIASSPAQLFLQLLCERHHVAFFPNEFKLKSDEIDREKIKQQEVERIFALASQAVPRPEGWGINE